MLLMRTRYKLLTIMYWQIYHLHAGNLDCHKSFLAATGAILELPSGSQVVDAFPHRVSYWT